MHLKTREENVPANAFQIEKKSFLFFVVYKCMTDNRQAKGGKEEKHTVTARFQYQF